MTLAFGNVNSAMKRLPDRVQQSILLKLRADTKNAASMNAEFDVSNANSDANIWEVFGIAKKKYFYRTTTSKNQSRTNIQKVVVGWGK